MYRNRPDARCATIVGMTSRLTHFAINTSDVETTQSFYGSVFGWSFQDYGPPGFVQIIDEETKQPMGAIQQRRELIEGAPTIGFECTIGVDDIDSTQAAIVAAGGKILMDKFTITSVGHLIAFEDPGGNPVLAMQYDSSAQ